MCPAASEGDGVADRSQIHPEGWYEAPDDPSRLRYWDGSRWTDEYRERPMQSPAAERPTQAPAADARSAPALSSAADGASVRFPIWFWLLLAATTLGVLLGAAEQHDQSCYAKTMVQVTSGNLSESHCLILPWNDPAEGRGLR
jgi:uncharacterized protein DUF2510